MSPATAVLDLAIRGGFATVLLFLLAFTLRHRSAAHRHLIWALGLTALLLLTVVVALSPSLPIELRLPAGTASAVLEHSPWAWTHEFLEGIGSDAPAPDAGNRRAVMADPGAGIVPGVPDAGRPSSGDDRLDPAADRFGPAHGFVLLYAIGLLFFLARAMEGRRRIRRLVHHGRSVPDDAPIGRELARLAARMGVRRRVSLVLADDCAMPLVAGSTRPVLCLPATARSWSRERREAVLLHELAHVHRRDGVWRLVAELAAAFHWWNPLAWTAARRARRCSESACDDLVMDSGVRPSSYATHLLALAAGPASPWWTWSAAGVAGGPDVIRRVDALADRGRRREPVTSGWIWTAAVLCAFGTAPLAALSPSFTQAAATRERAPVGPPVASDDVPVQLRWSGAAGTGAIFLEGTVSLDGSDLSDRSDSSGDPAGRTSAVPSDGLFLLFVADSVVGLRSLRVHPNAEGGWTRGLGAGDRLVTVDGEALSRAASWLEGTLADAGRKLGRLAEDVAWAGAPLTRAAGTGSGGRISGSLMSGAPAVSRDPDAGTFVASWTDGADRLGAFGRVRVADDAAPLPANRLPDLDDPAPGEWLVVFGWDRESRVLRVLEIAGRDGAVPLRRYSVNGAVRPFATAGRGWAAPLLPRLRMLIDF